MSSSLRLDARGSAAAVRRPAAAIGSMPSSTRRSSGSAEKRCRRVRPSGWSSVPARMALVSDSGADANRCAVAIERRDRAPERLRRRGQFRRDLLHQAGGAQLPHRVLGVARAQNLVELLHQPRRRAARDLVAVDLDRVEDRLVDRELQARGEHDRAQHADRIFEEPHRRVADAADQPRVRDPRARRRSR